MQRVHDPRLPRKSSRLGVSAARTLQPDIVTDDLAGARSTSDLYRIVSLLAEKGVAFKVVDDPSIDTTSRTGKLIMGILALIAEFENDIRRERQLDGIAKAKERGTRFGPKPQLTAERVKEIRELRYGGSTVPEIMRQTKLSKSSVYRALA